MKRIIVLVAAVFGLTAIAWAQGYVDCSGQCVCVNDATCSDQDDCGIENNDTDCQYIKFTALCSGTYTVESRMVCGSAESCKTCLSCVVLMIGSTPVTVHATCSPNDCVATAQVTLQQGQEYKLYTCFRHCWNYECADCEGCTAKGRVYFNVSDCMTCP